MINETAKRSDFKDKIVPHLEVLLQFSLWLTGDGRDAVRLMREALAEVYDTWVESISDEPCDVKLHYVLTRRFLNDGQQATVARISGVNVNFNEGADIDDCLDCATKNYIQRRSWFAGESNDVDNKYLAAFAGLPPAFRSVMILSYLEGFSNGEIANLAGVRPHAVELTLNRGRSFLREELFAHLMGEVNLDTIGDREAATG